MITEYNSFEEIDAQLKILKLRREIDAENISLCLNRAKADISPTQLFGGFKNTLQIVVLQFTISQLRKVFQKGRRPQLLRW